MTIIGYSLVLALSRIGLVRACHGHQVDEDGHHIGGKSLMWRWYGGSKTHITHEVGS